MTRMPKWAAKRDANEGQIVAALRQVGATVILMKLPVDAIVLFRGATFLMDFKSAGGRLTESQRTLRDTWQGGPLCFPRTAEEALTFIGAMEGE